MIREGGRCCGGTQVWMFRRGAIDTITRRTTTRLPSGGPEKHGASKIHIGGGDDVGSRVGGNGVGMRIYSGGSGEVRGGS